MATEYSFFLRGLKLRSSMQRSGKGCAGRASLERLFPTDRWGGCAHAHLAWWLRGQKCNMPGPRKRTEAPCIRRLVKDAGIT